MCKMIDQYADKIKGQFSFFDRMIINGYFRPLLSEQTRIGYLYSMGIPLRDFTEYFKDVTDRLLKQIEDSAGELGRPVVYLPSAKDRKEDIAKGFLLSDPVDEGLICVLKTLESCRTAKVVGREGRHFLRSSYTKCLHYYLYYLDREFGFMFVKIQTWFPFNIQVYINGRELMKHIFDANGISYQCYDNSFTDISDVAKAQELADRFDSRIPQLSHLLSVPNFYSPNINLFPYFLHQLINCCTWTHLGWSGFPIPHTFFMFLSRYLKCLFFISGSEDFFIHCCI